MSFQRVAPWLILALCLSVAVIVLGAGRGAQMLVGASAGLFALVVLVVGLRANQPLWSEEQTTDEAAVEAARFNAWLMAIAFVWGAVAMFAVYTLSGLRWQHGWQYGAGMALLGAFAYVFGVLLDRAGPGARRPVLQRGLQLTMLQGVAAVAGLVFLIGSRKLETFRPDWAANQIFLFGGLAIVGLSAIAVITQRKLMRA